MGRIYSTLTHIQPINAMDNTTDNKIVQENPVTSPTENPATYPLNTEASSQESNQKFNAGMYQALVVNEEMRKKNHQAAKDYYDRVTARIEAARARKS